MRRSNRPRRDRTVLTESKGGSSEKARDERPMYIPSSSEEEDFNDAEGGDENGKWDVEIIGEEVAMNGCGEIPDIRYEARWSNWSRADGTNVTWKNELLDENDIKVWTRKEAERRKNLAQECTDIDVGVFTNLDVHLTATQYRRHAVEEKLELWDSRQSKPYVSMESLTRRNLAIARDCGFAVDSDAAYGLEVESDDDDDVMADDELPSLSIRTSPRNRFKTIGQGSKTTATTSNRPPSSSSTLRSSSSRTPSTVNRSHPIHKAVTRSPASSQYLSTSLSPSQSSFVTPLSAKARGKQRALSPWPSVSTSTPLSAKAKGKKRARSPSILSSEEMNLRPSVTPVHAPSSVNKTKKRAASLSSTVSVEDMLMKKPKLSPSLTRQRELQDEWSAIAQQTRAAPITITNEVDDDGIPPLPKGFRYIESEYFYSKKVPRADSIDPGIFVRCECKGMSTCTAQCSCQEPSELYISDNKGGSKKVLAYTSDRLFNSFNVPRGIEVIECNKQCPCNPSKCPNRVAQQPRDVPIDVFKTTNKGWGVRSPVDIKRGKVLGIYTGLLITRAAADALPESKRSYLFDIDGREALDGNVPDNVELYSVDSMAHGNWTRFINHSCNPNLMVYLVVYDTIPEMNMPYIAFVATRYIPARTELLFDYDPAATKEFLEQRKSSKDKTKHKIPEGRQPCSCGAGTSACRGYV